MLHDNTGGGKQFVEAARTARNTSFHCVLGKAQWPPKLGPINTVPNTRALFSRGVHALGILETYLKPRIIFLSTEETPPVKKVTTTMSSTAVARKHESCLCVQQEDGLVRPQLATSRFHVREAKLASFCDKNERTLHRIVHISHLPSCSPRKEVMRDKK